MPLTEAQKEYHRQWRAKNKDRVRAYNEAYQSKNKETLKEKRKPYFNARDAELRAVKTRWVAEYLASHPCVDCGEADPQLLEFDHVRGVKTATISVMRRSRYTLKRLQAEVKKCDVRCISCHRKRTLRLGRKGWRTKNT